MRLETVQSNEKLIDERRPIEAVWYWQNDGEALRKH
jgi:hypothetical protein